MEQKRGSFSGQLGFILAAAGSAVGLGNIWRFPFYAAKDGGGIFLLVYLILAVTFGFTLLTTEVAIGRRTAKSPLLAYKEIHPKWGGIGILACLVPTIILPYYCSIGGWVFKYLELYLTNQSAVATTENYFVNYIGTYEPLIWMLLYFAITSIIVVFGVEKGIEKMSRILMPILVVLIVGISLFSLTMKHTDAEGITRTGLQGLKVYVIPNFKSLLENQEAAGSSSPVMTVLRNLMSVIMDAMGQLFFSISVAMGIMVAYGSYAKKETNLMNSINQIEIFDTAIAFLAGMMIIPAVFTYAGPEGMKGGPGLIFIALPQVFASMGLIGKFIGPLFFIIVAFAAVTSSVSVMEAIVSSIMEAFHMTRLKACILVTVYTLITGVIVCLGYNVLLVNIPFPTGDSGQILDLMDYISNNIMMPLVAFLTSILIGWVVKPDVIIEEVTQGNVKFARKGLYVVMIKFVVPIMLLLLLLKSLGVLKI